MLFCLPANRRLTYFLLTVLLTLSSSQSVLASKVRVTTDRNPVNINESFQIIFNASETPDAAPDFSPLKRDFEILNQQQSSQSSWVNGSFSKSIQWTLNVMAKRSGTLVIPSVAFGQDASPSLSVTVRQASGTASNDEELFLDVEVAPGQGYVQAQLIYTIRFYRRVQITQASLSEPELASAIVEKLGEDSNYQTDIHGIQYAVTERKYAVFPQQSGQLTIPPLELTAQVLSNGRSRFNGFFSSQSTQTKRVTSRAVTLNVLPAPNNFPSDHWLPAEKMQLEQKWSQQNLNVKVGEPLTRTVTLVAQGVTLSQLPELADKLDDPKLKSYPDQPVTNERKNADGVTALREEKTAFIPTAPGSYTLPALDIPWFNTQTRQIERATLPSVTITATGAPQAETTAPPLQTVPANKSKTVSVATASAQPEVNAWKWLTLFFGSGWLLTLGILLRGRLKKPRQSVAQIDDREVRLKNIVNELRKACRTSNLHSAKQALLEWGNILYGCASLGALAPFCEARLRDEILHLNHCLYAADHTPWDGKKLFQAFAEHNARKQIKQPVEDELEPLYPKNIS